jgi:hypothetical protein
MAMQMLKKLNMPLVRVIDAVMKNTTTTGAMMIVTVTTMTLSHGVMTS